MFAQVVKQQASVDRRLTLTVDRKNLSPSCSGGVELTCNGGTIKVDNTLDTRLDLVMEQDLPSLRKMLFPGR